MSAVPTQTQINSIRAAYSPLVAGDAAAQALIGPWPTASGWIKGQAQLFYQVTGGAQPLMSGLDREKVIIPLLAASAALPGNLAIHVYWGIAEGMSVDEVYAALALAAMYGGVHAYSDGLKIAAIVLGIMANQPADKLDTLNMMGAVSAAFPAGQTPA